MPLSPPALPSSLPSDSSFSALRGLVGDPVEDFLPLSPEIIAIEDSLPMALTALPVFWKADTGVGLGRRPWVPPGSGAQGGEPSPAEAAVRGPRASRAPRSCQKSEPDLALLSTISVSEDVRRMEWGLEPMCALM